MGTQATLLAGVSIGLAVAAPIGPMAIIVIRRTLVSGFLAGLTTGAGASTVHLLYATLAIGGLDRIASQFQQNRDAIDVVIAVSLMFFAVRMMRHRVTNKVAALHPGRSLMRDYASALAFCSVNPMTFALLLSAIAALADFSRSGTGQASTLAAGVFAGSIGWWICLVWITAMVGLRLSLRSMRVIDVVAGTVMFGLAISTLIRDL